MLNQWTFSRRISASLGIGALLAVVIGIIAVVALRSVVASNERVVAVNVQALLDAKQLETLLERKSGAGRGFLLGSDDVFINRVNTTRSEFLTVLDRMKRTAPTEADLRLIEAVGTAEAAHQQSLEQLTAARRANPVSDPIARRFDEELAPRKDEAVDERALARLRSQSRVERTIDVERRAGLRLIDHVRSCHR